MQVTAIPREAQAATSSLSNLLKANLQCWAAERLLSCKHYLGKKQQLSNSSHFWLLEDFPPRV